MSDVGGQSPGGDRLFGDDPEADDSTIVDREGIIGHADRFPSTDGITPAESQVRRVLEAGQPGHDELRNTAPIPTTAMVPIVQTSPSERFLDWVHPWRTWLVFGLAAIITASVAGAYLGGTGSGSVTLTRRAEAPSVLAKTTISSTLPEKESAIAAPGTDGPTTTSLAGIVRPAPSSGNSPTTGRQGTVTPSTAAPASSLVATTSAAETTTTTESDVGTPSTLDGPPTTVTDPGETTPSSGPDSPTSTAGSSTTLGESTSTTGISEEPEKRKARVEAESGRLHGTAAVRRDHEGFSGSGFVGDLYTRGSGITIRAKSEAGGTTPFTVRYSAGKESGPAGSRMLTVFVNGDRVIRADMAVTASWSDWDVVVGEVPLEAGLNDITLIWDDDDTGWVNLDYIEIN